MDNQRLLIWAFFGLMGWITYQTWVQDYAPQPIAQAQQQIEQPGLVAPSADDELPELSATSDDSLDAPLPANEEQGAISVAASSAPTIRVITDVLDIDHQHRRRHAAIGVPAGLPGCKGSTGYADPAA